MGAGRPPGPVWTGAENLTPTGNRPSDRPTRSQSLYRLRYPPQTIQRNDIYSISSPLVSENLDRITRIFRRSIIKSKPVNVSGYELDEFRRDRHPYKIIHLGSILIIGVPLCVDL